MKSLIILALACAAFPWSHADDPKPATPPAATAVTKPRVDHLAFLQGTWMGEMDGAHVEEIWSCPNGNNIMGCFRWMKPDGTPMMFEILVISAEKDGTFLRLAHFSPTLVMKEKDGKPLSLRLNSSEANRAEFTAADGPVAAVTYHRKETTLHITVALRPGPDGTDRPPLVFELKRQ